jgi:hypothetical protein
LEIEPKKCHLWIFVKKKRGGGQLMDNGKLWYKEKRFLRSNQLHS